MTSRRITKNSCRYLHDIEHSRALESSWGSDSGTWEGWAATGNERGQRADALKVTFFFIDLIIRTPGPSWKKSVPPPLSHSLDTDNRLRSPNQRGVKRSEEELWEAAACSLRLCENIFLPQPHPTSAPALSLRGIPHIQRTTLSPRNQPQGPVGTPCHPPLPPSYYSNTIFRTNTS